MTMSMTRLDDDSDNDDDDDDTEDEEEDDIINDCAGGDATGTKTLQL